MPIRTLLLAPSPDSLATMSRDLLTHDDSLQVSTQNGGVVDLGKLLQRGEVDLAVAQVPAISESDLSLIGAALAAQPGVALILVTNEISSDFLLRSMRAGVREVVQTGAPTAVLVSAFKRQLERFAIARGTANKGKVIAFMPAKGGSGATFLATNLAFALAARGQKVAVLDMNLQFGDVALFVSDRVPSANIADVSREVNRLDASLLESSMMKVAENLWVLAAPDSPERSVEVKPEVVERIIMLCRSQYDFVILDVGRILESVSIRALDAAQTIYVVLQAALPTLHDARRLITVLNGLGYGRDKLKIVVNRLEKGGDLGVAEVTKTLGYEVARQVPNSYANVVHSINHGIPILKHTPKDPVARTLVEWADALVPRQERNAGWLRGMFGARS